MTRCRYDSNSLRATIMIMQEKNCHSFKMADGFNGSHAHEKYLSFTKTLTFSTSAEDGSITSSEDNNGYVVEFMTENDYSVQFQAEILGEKLGKYEQVCTDLLCVELK